jgi:hypothetical protein
LTTDTVLSLGPAPPFRTNASTNICIVATICSISSMDKMSLVCGIVMFLIFCQMLAPSSSAASYSSPGMFCSAAR